ncbi:MAG: hypothetical protein KGI75_14595 [Rhizobiaceae bacterium]|nr:hypothetical protein [Rhizobiaceae bacterium]
MRVRYDPRNLSRVQVETVDNVVWTVRFADLRPPCIPLAEHHVASAALRTRGVRAVKI